MLYRSMRIEVLKREKDEEGNEVKDDRIPIALSSEEPVERYDWWTGERYFEILDHSAEAVDLSYAADGLPFFREHNRYTHQGIIEDVQVGDDRKLRGMLKLSRTAKGQETRQDIDDGILKKVSVGYIVRQLQLVEDDEEKGSTYRATRWMPMEGSAVAIPADYSVGLNRAANGAAVPVRLRAPDTPPEGKEALVKVETPPQEGANDLVAAERKRQREIRSIGRLNDIAEERVERWIEQGASTEQVAVEIVHERTKEIKAQIENPSDLDLSPSDRKPYSVGRAIKALSSGNWQHAGYERALSQALAKRIGQDPQGILMPMNHPLQGRTPLTTGGATTGASLVFTEPGSFIELLRNRALVLSMGTTLLSGFRGNLALPRQTAAGTPAMVAENPGSDFAESNLTLDLVNWDPKSIAATEAYSKQILAQSIEAVDQLIINDLFAIVALLLDAQVLHGPGTGNTIEGIYAKTGVNAVAFGGSITYAKAVEMETAIEADNADLGAMGYLATPETKGKAKTVARFTNTDTPIWTGGKDGEMNGYRAAATNQLAKNLGAGTNEHGIVFAAWGQGMIVDWGALDLTIDPYTRAKQGLVNITALYMADWNTRHPESFAKGTGLIP